jgi:hypothetical protein
VGGLFALSCTLHFFVSGCAPEALCPSHILLLHRFFYRHFEKLMVKTDSPLAMVSEVLVR